MHMWLNKLPAFISIPWHFWDLLHWGHEQARGLQLSPALCYHQLCNKDRGLSISKHIQRYAIQSWKRQPITCSAKKGTHNLLTSPGTVFCKILTPHVEVRHEYTVYDFGGIVGTVGGSFCLFIGYSFFECFVNICKRLQRCVSWVSWDEVLRGVETQARKLHLKTVSEMLDGDVLNNTQ